jgi:hypothetical protein
MQNSPWILISTLENESWILNWKLELEQIIAAINEIFIYYERMKSLGNWIFYQLYERMTQSLTQPVPLISLSESLFLESSAHTNGVNNAFVLLLRRATNKKAA